MQPHQQRVIDEKKELDSNREKLSSFMHGDIYASMNSVEQGLMMVQLVAMDNYSDALARRIELF